MTAAAEPMIPIDYAQVQALQNDPTIWTLENIAEELEVSKIAVQKWRWKTLQHVEKEERVPLAHDTLPVPDAPDSKPRRPKWYAGSIRTWAMQVGRMLPDGTAQHMPRRGRPKKSLHSDE